MTSINGTNGNIQTDLQGLHHDEIERRAKRERANLLRRINRKLKPGNRKLPSLKDNAGERGYFLVDTSNPIIHIEEFGRRLGVANCLFCKRPAKYKVSDCDVCVGCAVEWASTGGAR